MPLARGLIRPHPSLVRSGGLIPPRPSSGPGWYFTAGRMRTPTALGTVAASEEFTGHKSQWISDDFEQNHFYIALWNGYTDNTGAEHDGSHAFDLVGVALHAFYGGTWKTVVPHSVASPNLTIFSSGTKTFGLGVKQLIGPFTFPDWVPNESLMSCILRVNTSVGAFLPTNIKLRSGSNEGASRTIEASDFLLTVTGTMGGTDGRFDGEMMAPSFVIAKPRNHLDRPVFRCGDDSIVWGKNSNENTLPGATTGSMGAVALAMDSKTGKKRYPFANFACPGAGPDDATPGKDALIRLCPNRPYTHAIINHLNNVGGDANQFKTEIGGWALKVKAESKYWGDAAAPVYHLGVLPKPGTTDFCTTLENQGSSGINYPSSARWGFEAMLLAGEVPGIDGVVTNERLKYDLADNRDRWKLTGFSTTLAGNYTQNATSISLTDNPGVGSMIVVDPAIISAARHVTAVSGTGPYTCTIESGINSALLVAATTVKTTYAGDSGSTGGTHPATPGHVLWALDIAEWMAPRFG